MFCLDAHRDVPNTEGSCEVTITGKHSSATMSDCAVMSKLLGLSGIKKGMTERGKRKGCWPPRLWHLGISLCGQEKRWTRWSTSLPSQLIIAVAQTLSAPSPRLRSPRAFLACGGSCLWNQGPGQGVQRGISQGPEELAVRAAGRWWHCQPERLIPSNAVHLGTGRR